MTQPHRATFPLNTPERRRRRLLQGASAWVGLSAMGGTTAALGQAGGAAPALGQAGGAAPALGQAGGAAPAGAEPPRLALLMGNRDYPGGDDLPPIYKNVHDLRAALEKRGFSVSEGLDLELPQARSLMATFAAEVRAAPADATAFFYFSGHGAQLDAENLLVSAHTSPRAQPDTLAKGSLTLTNGVIGQLPVRPLGLTIAVVDACRTSLRDVAKGEGLNQVEAPPGCLIAFATGAGKPAIAPADDTRNTFYTGSLVKLLGSASDETSFSDLFRLVKYDVQNTMLNHPVPLLRQFAQFPFIAENTQVLRRLAPRVAVDPAAAPGTAAAPIPPLFEGSAEEQDFKRLEGAIWPPEVASLAGQYLKDHPNSRLAGSAQVAREGAAEAAEILRQADLKLYRSAFQLPADSPRELTTDLVKAARGDKDAAARLGRAYRRDAPRRDRGLYEGWLQYAAALGNGIASYELALHYRRENRPLLAQQSEARARELGYTPPPSLDNTRK